MNSVSTSGWTRLLRDLNFSHIYSSWLAPGHERPQLLLLLLMFLNLLFLPRSCRVLLRSSRISSFFTYFFFLSSLRSLSEIWFFCVISFRFECELLGWFAQRVPPELLTNSDVVSETVSLRSEFRLRCVLCSRVVSFFRRIENCLRGQDTASVIHSFLLSSYFNIYYLYLLL